MTNISNIQPTNSHPQSQQQSVSGSTGIPRNVSFAKDSNESTAYREHNPPTVLRRQEAARRELSPSGNASHLLQDEVRLAEKNKNQAPHVENEHRDSISPFTSHIHSQAGPDSTGKEYTTKENFRSVNSSATSGQQQQPQQQQQYLQHHLQQQQQEPSAAVTSTGAPSTTESAAAATTAANKVQVNTSHPLLSQQGPKSAGASHTSLASSSSSTGGAPPSNNHSEEANKQDEVHILVAVTGSVATIKLPQIIHKLKQIYRKRAIIQVVVTKASTTFFDASDLPRDIKIWYDSDEWRSRQAPTSGSEMGSQCDQQLHIRLRRWADILLVAPCSANTLAKFTFGICDNLLTSIFRVWNPEVPILLAPAMNTHMYTNPVTKLHYNILKDSYPFVEILKPVEKVLVCGDIGMGGMREWTDIVQILVKRLGVPFEEEDEDDSEDEDENA